MDIDVTLESMNFLDAIASETRVKIIAILNKNPSNIGDIAADLDISSAIVTRHIQKLEEAGIVKCESIAGKRGMQKMCCLNMDQVTLRFRSRTRSNDYYLHSIPIGQYSSYSIAPTCGLASEKGIIGILDDPRYFAEPDHIKASLLWFGSGWIEYILPNYILSNQTVISLEISLEICSEAPGYNESWPSDITFYINGVNLGLWTSPGDFGKTRGVLTPDWWDNGTQHGLLKNILVNEKGSFIDGIRMSDVTINDLNLIYGRETIFRIANYGDARNVGGVSIFGKNFGNYNQDIKVIISYG